MSGRDFFWPDDPDLRVLADSVRESVSAAERGAVLAPDNDIWQRWIAMEFDRVGLPERFGGPGGTLHDVVTVEMTLAAVPVSLPALATTVLTHELLGDLDHPRERGLLPLLPQRPAPLVDGRVTARIDGVWWYGGTSSLLLPVVLGLDGGSAQAWSLARLDIDEKDVVVSENLAGEPRARLDLRERRVTVLDAHWALSRYRKVQATAVLLTAARLVGALREVRDLTVTYVAERRQFDRPLAVHPVVQQGLAEIAEQVSAALAALDLAARTGHAGQAFAAGHRAAEAAGVVARLSHQLQGAMGTSREYPLGLYTRRLWAWTDETDLVERSLALLQQEVNERTEVRGDLWAAVEALRGSGRPA
ncbi:acyl-CoA dehydrogenase family protein [Nonomuraea sp. NPDC049649]|uniref:acyl-CoA dehydrogenase family protein n=1 Tax=Nonomuraea sp. NPDC049649 TaxID=3155776 RepID=UPI00342019A3